MRVQHLHCAIMYSKWLHKCFFFKLEEKNAVKKKKKVFIVEALLKVSLCYPFRGEDVKNPRQRDSNSLERVREKSFRT